MSIITKTTTQLSIQATDTQYLVTTGSVIQSGEQLGGWGAVIATSAGYDTSNIKTLSGTGNPPTALEMELSAAVQALRSLPVDGIPALVSSYNEELITGMNRLRHVWAANNWLTRDGEPVEHRSLWEALMDEADRREVAWECVRDDERDEYTEQASDLALSAMTLLRGSNRD